MKSKPFQHRVGRNWARRSGGGVHTTRGEKRRADKERADLDDRVAEAQELALRKSKALYSVLKDDPDTAPDFEVDDGFDI